MIGFPDEYEKGSKYYGDPRLIMHSGEALRQRHRAPFRKFVDKTVKFTNI